MMRQSSRRNFLARLAAGAGALALTGCDRLVQDDNLDTLLR